MALVKQQTPAGVTDRGKSLAMKQMQLIRKTHLLLILDRSDSALFPPVN